MRIPVLVTRVQENGYRAQGGAPFPLSAEGATRDEAMEKLQRLIQDCMKAGAELAFLEVEEPNPWKKLAGIYQDDPYLDEYRQGIADRRRQIEEDSDRP